MTEETMALAAVGAAVSLALPAWMLALWLRGRGINPFRALAKFLPRGVVGWMLLCVSMLGFFKSGATKETNGVRGASAELKVKSAELERGQLFNSQLSTPNSSLGSNSVLRFTSLEMGSNSMSLALAWCTNFAPARAWLELHEQLHSLTNGWWPSQVREIADGETNAVFEVAMTNGSPACAFYRAYVDTLELALGGCSTYLREDGTIIHVATHTGGFPVAVSRPDRPAGLSAPDPAFAANPFTHAEGLSYDPDSGTLHVASNGTYRLPDGSELFVSSEPTVTFGIAHAYSGPEYPLDSPSLRAGWMKGGSPLTGCSCVPEADFGDGIVVSGSSTPSRSGGGPGGLPDGMRLEWDYEPGGVWVTCLVGTNVVWRKWASHECKPDYGGRTDLTRSNTQIPGLLKAYLMMGAQVSRNGFIDYDFNCCDVMTILDCSNLNERFMKRFLGG